MVGDERPDDEGADGTQEHHPRGDVLQLAHNRIVLRFNLIEQIFNQSIHNFRSEDEEDRQYDERNFDESELQHEGHNQCERGDCEMNFKVPLFADHRVKAAECVAETAEEDAGHEESIPHSAFFVTIDCMTQRRTMLWIAAGFLAPGFLIYARSLFNGFVDWDDGLLVINNPIIRGPTPLHVWQAFTSYDPELYIPLTFLSYQINFLLGGLHAFGYHLVNLVLHVGNAVLVTGIISLLMTPQAERLLLSKKSAAALFAGLLFLVHPLHTEAVAWASARKDVLSAFFFLLSLFFFLHFLRDHREKWYRVSVCAFFIALLAKVTVIVLPLILVLAAWRERERFDRSFVLRLVPFFGLSILFGVIALFGKQGNTSLLTDKILIGSKATVFYLTHLFYPADFSVLYPYTSVISIGNPDLLIPVLVIIAITAGTILSVRILGGNRDVLFGWFFFLLLLLPSFANFVKGKDILLDVYFASDRYAYLASVGILIIIVPGFYALYKWKRIPVMAAGVLIIVFLSLLSYRQSLTWRNTETLFQNVLASYPDSHLAHNNLRSLADRRGDLKTAAMEYTASLAVRPNSAAFFNLGQMYMQLKLPDRAMEMYRKALEQNPDDRDSLINLGVLLLNAGNVNESIAVLEHARNTDDRFAPAYFNLGLAYEKAGRRADAVAAYRRATELDPAGEAAAGRLRVLGE